MIRIMKSRTAIFSALVCICGAFGGHASECIGDGCVFEYEPKVMIGEPTPLGEPSYNDLSFDQYDAVITNAVPYAIQMPVMPRPIALVPVDHNNVAAAPWDGTQATFIPRKFDKTVDWRDGAPIWDEGVAHYRDRDFSDWYSPMDIYYYSDQADFVTRDAVENLLTPNRPSENLWLGDDDTDTTTSNDCESPTPAPQPAPCDPCAKKPVPQPKAPRPAVATVIQPVPVLFDDGCPFDTDAECAIWRRKPMIRESVSPRSPRIRDDKMGAFIDAALCDPKIKGNDPLAAPLISRYRMLMDNARACCTDGMVHALRQAGASNGLIYKFMADDANFYNLGARCLMTTDKEFDEKYPNTATAAVAADVRNGCLCRNREWFYAMLAPFQAAYDAAPEFKQARFWYTYTDGLQREITVSVNTDIQNVLNQLALCP